MHTETLEQNMTNLYGAQGARWVTDLPAHIAALAVYWSLRELTPISNMTFHYLAKAILPNNEPVVLKIGYDGQGLTHEKQTLRYFNGQGSVKLLDDCDKYNALLLQQVIPGITLTSQYAEQPDKVMDCYIATMQKLHRSYLFETSYHPQVSDWLKALHEPAAQQIPMVLLNKAIVLSQMLLSSPKSRILLHGDLHHDNILKHGNEWLAIDPKGVIGEAEFEIAAFEFMYIPMLSTIADVKEIMAKRVALLGQKSGLDAQRLKDWMFVRLVLMAVWLIEDHSNASDAIKLAELIMS